MNLFNAFIVMMITYNPLSAGKFKFRDIEKNEWVESSDFGRTLRHYKGLGTVYEIEGYGKYRVNEEIAETTTTNITRSPPQQQRFGTVMKTLKNSEGADRVISSFNGKDQISFLMEKDRKITLLYFLISSKSE